jgi:hypothetical protein
MEFRAFQDAAKWPRIGAQGATCTTEQFYDKYR